MTHPTPVSHYTQTRTAQVMPPKVDAPRKPSMTEAEMGRAWLKLINDEKAKKARYHEPRGINRVAPMAESEFKLNKRRRASLEFIASREESGTADLGRLHKVSESRARHDADKLVAAGFITAKMQGRRLAYRITPAGNVFLDTTEIGAPIKKMEASQ